MNTLEHHECNLVKAVATAVAFAKVFRRDDALTHIEKAEEAFAALKSHIFHLNRRSGEVS